MKAVVQAPICPLMSQPRPDCELADEALCGWRVEIMGQRRTLPLPVSWIR